MNDREHESEIARILSAAGARDRAPEELRRSVYDAVHQEWRATVAARARRRGVTLALAAGVVLAVAGIWAARVMFAPRGEDIVTDATQPRTLEWPGGLSLRLDRGTHIVRWDGGHIALRAGALYVDAGAARKTPALLVDTPAGVVSHLGTQYEVRLLPEATRIRVREGRVALSGATHLTMQARDELTVAGSGLIVRNTIAPDSPAWEWAERAAPAFGIEGHTLAEFLNWVGRELGREIVYSSPEAQAEAARAQLSGSIAGLTPGEALSAVVPTTHLHASTQNGQIQVSIDRH